MNQEDVLVRLKKDVRSLLVSSKFGLDPHQLWHDYVAMLGCPMPLKVLGFRNIMDMVKEMPDVVSVHFRPDGSHFLKAVGNEATRNIEELVAKQRSPKSKEKSKRGGSRSFSPHYFQPHSPVVFPRRGPAPLALPAELRAQLRTLLSQGVIRLSELESRFLRCIGRPLRVHSYGFYSIVEMLGAASDLVCIHQSRLGSLLSLREHMLPRQQLIPFSSSRGAGPKQPETLRTSKPASEEPTQARAQTPAAPPADVPVKPRTPKQPGTDTGHAPVSKQSVSHKLETVDEKDEGDPELLEDGRLFQKQVLKLEEALCQQILENGVAGTISQELKSKLRQVVSQTSGGVSVHDLPAEYKRVFGEDLPLPQSGFVSVTELVSALSDTFHLKPAESDQGQYWIVMDIQDAGTTQSESQENKSFYFSCGTSPWEGSGDDDSNEEDNQNEKLEINHNTTNFERVSEIYPSIQMYCSPCVPPDAMQSQRLKPPFRHAARELVPVLVEHVETPGNFHIRVTEQKMVHALEDMMFSMRQCYNCPGPSERYVLPERFVRRGQVCCVKPNDWFYRVVIHRIVSPTQVEVYYVDYGVMTVELITKLKFLKSCYSSLPAQAVPSSLAGIKPNLGSWTTEATDYFKSMCSDRPLVGALDGYTGDVLRLYLCDTSTDEDIYIHTMLLSQGHGTACTSAACAALCTQVTPVTLYLGEGRVDLPELEEETTPSLKLANIPEQWLSPKVEDEEVPGLELIVHPDIQAAETNPFSSLISKQTLSCDELGLEMDNALTLPNNTTPLPSSQHEQSCLKVASSFFQKATSA